MKPLIEAGITGVYIVHAKKGYEIHEKRIVDLFAKMDLPFEFVTDGDVSNFTEELISNRFCSEINEILSKGVLSCTLNHMFCYEKMIANNDKYALVFENDPFFLGDFMQDIIRIAKEADKLEPGFIISLENTTLEFPKGKLVKKDKLLYEAQRGRCAGAYLLDLRAAKIMINDLKANKCFHVIDWWHNNMIDRGVVRMYWAHPALTEQGSHNGRMSSTISSKKKNLIRRVKWILQKKYKTALYKYIK